MLESTRRVDTIVLDKTGTVTEGRMALVAIVTAPGVDRAEALRLVGARRARPEHPMPARSPTRAAREAPLPPSRRSGAARASASRASSTGTRRRRPAVAPRRMGRRAGAELGARSTPRRRGQDGGRRRVGRSGARVFVVADTVKPTSAEAIAELKRLGLRPVLLTGDNEPTARAVAAEVGIDDVIAERAPGRQGRGRRAPAGARARRRDGRRRRQRRAGARAGRPRPRDRYRHRRRDRGERPDAGLRRPARRRRRDPPSRRTLATIKGNLFWAFAYNVAALPLAAAGYLNPLIAGGAMAFSSVFVVSNSLRLRGFKARRVAAETTLTGE